ncbi:glycosyltransferase family 39 protein [Rathayibacter sp. YIM 133350]|uniref:glycosyltransferase family 39 protein n=1 Tax=Rathayibacter sp. YIM 133350 TaxID=3131992 RepID=UPI00307D0A3A
MTTQSVSTWSVPVVGTRSATRARVTPAALTGALGTLVIFLGSWNPSYWGDEAASVMSAERSLPSLFRELGYIDAVHGAYYLFLHFWIGAFGASELAVRAPSAIAAGLAAAGVVVLVQRFTDRRFAVLAGVVFLALPRVGFAGVEARSYAMSIAAAVWLTVLLVWLIRSERRRWLPWLAYGLALGASAYLFLYLLLLAVVHAVFIVGTSSGRRAWKQAAVALVLAVAVAAPILAIAVAEKKQISFLARRDYAKPYSVLVSQFFDWVPLAVLAWALIACLVVVMLQRRLTPLQREGALLGFAWLVLPTTLLLVGNAYVSPMYNIRYLTFCTPAVAALIAGGAAALPGIIQRLRERRADPDRPRRRIRAGTLTAEIVVLVLVMALPTYIADRGPYAKDNGSDLRQMAEAVDSISHPGDAIVFDQDTKPSQHPRLALRLYPAHFAGLVDVGLTQAYTDRRKLWDRVAPVADLAPELAGTDRVLAVEMGTEPGEPIDVRSLRQQGFEVTGVKQVHRTVIYTLEREDA